VCPLISLLDLNGKVRIDGGEGQQNVALLESGQLSDTLANMGLYML
jgi:hypothetical protein